MPVKLTGLEWTLSEVWAGDYCGERSYAADPDKESDIYWDADSDYDSDDPDHGPRCIRCGGELDPNMWSATRIGVSTDRGVVCDECVGRFYVVFVRKSDPRLPKLEQFLADNNTDQ